MKKLLFAVCSVTAFTVAGSITVGCGPELRTMPPVAEHKQGFKSAIQNNPNIPDSAKKSFK